MLDFLFGRMFFWDILLVALIGTANFPKRTHYPLRAAGAVLGGTVISCGWTALFSPYVMTPLPMGLLTTTAEYIGAFSIILLLVSFCVQTNFWSIMYMGTIFWFVQQLSNSLAYLLFSQAGKSYLAFFIHSTVLLMITLLVCWHFLFRIDAGVLGRIRLQKIVPVCGIVLLACVMLNTVSAYKRENSISYYLAVILLDCIAVMYQKSVYELAGSEREQERYRLLLEQNRKQYQISKDSMEQVNIKCHDLRHQLRHFRKENRVDEAALQEIERAVDNYDTTVHTGNAALDVILTEKMLICRNRKIGFTCMAEGKGLDYIDPTDLYALFGNALDNAIEATERLDDAEKKQISLTVRPIGGFYSIQLQNYCSEPLQFEHGIPQTSKPDKQNHGFGVRSMQLLTEKYGGELSFRQEEDVVSLYLLLPSRSTSQ